MTRKQRQHRGCSSSRRGIPRQIWVLIEVLLATMILHYTHVPIGNLLPLIRLLARW